jgi:uncharacterized protein YnzC (UPF0291/DUF896 family)
VTTASAQKKYDGQKLETPDREPDGYKIEILNGVLPEGFEVHVEVTGSQTEIGASKNTARVWVKDNRKDMESESELADVTDLVNLEVIYGTLTVLSPTVDLEDLVLTPVYISKTFDGTPLDYSELLWNEKLEITEQLQKLLDAGYTWEVEIRGERTEPGKRNSYVNGQTFKLFDPDGNDVTGRYNLITQGKPGTMQVFAREPIKIYLYSLDVIYDGKYPEWTMYDYVIEYDGMEIEGQPAEDGSYVYYEFIDTDGNQVRLEIDWVRGPEKASGSWTVAELNKRFHNCVSYRATVNGHYADFDSMPLELVMFEEDPSTYPLTVEQISIEFTAASEKREYDPDNREPLTNDGYHITKGALAEGHRVWSVSVQSDAYLVGIGQCNNKITNVVIVDEDGGDVTEHYSISYVDGLLELI